MNCPICNAQLGPADTECPCCGAPVQNPSRQSPQPAAYDAAQQPYAQPGYNTQQTYGQPGYAAPQQQPCGQTVYVQPGYAAPQQTVYVQPGYAAPQQTGYVQPGYAAQQQPAAYERKSRVIYQLICLFLGGLGIHDFYAERKTDGLIHVCMMISGIVLGLIAGGSNSRDLALIAGLLIFFNGIWALAQIFAVTRDGNGQEMK